jgi:hypothetical protein
MAQSQITLVTGNEVVVEMSAKDVQNRMGRVQTLVELPQGGDEPPVYVNSSHVVSIEDYVPRQPIGARV